MVNESDAIHGWSELGRLAGQPPWQWWLLAQLLIAARSSRHPTGHFFGTDSLATAAELAGVLILLAALLLAARSLLSLEASLSPLPAPMMTTN